MKKIYMFIALLFVSGVIFAQVQRAAVGTLSSVKVLKEINNLPASNSKAVIDSLNYDGANTNSIGTGAVDTFGVYTCFPASILAPHASANHYLLSVKVYINDISTITSTQLRFYSDTLATAMVYSQNFTPVDGWNNVYLTTPFAVPSTGKLFIGYNVTTAAGGYPAGCDAGPTNVNGNWMYMGLWAHLSDLNATLIGNWNIRAMCGTLPTTPEAACTPLAWAAGGLLINTSATSGSITLTNTGIGTLTCSGITGLSAPFTTTLVPTSVNLTATTSTTFNFTYHPTAVGTNNQTVVIATNGGNVTINLSGSCLPAASVNWDFNQGIPSTFALINDANGANNPYFSNAWVAVEDTDPISGDSCAASTSWFTTPAIADRWMITQGVVLTSGNILKWDSRSIEAAYADGFLVKLSTTGKAKANFTNTLKTVAAENITWTSNTIDLTPYNGQTVYIAFIQNSNDMNQIRIDNIQILGSAALGINEVNADNNNLSIYPNPVKNELNITSTGALKNVKIINAIGQEIMNENISGNHYKINTSSYNKGVYFVQIQSENGKSIKKFVVSE